ncbi:MAG: NAD(P)/FAD-dependent oxidoreductase [Actinomycetota bacterium]|nr:NAD(P)/FAD-dependent oxidoreductase [Actinomycetota bacterium]
MTPSTAPPAARVAPAPAEPVHVDVLVVGAGLSGICAGHYLQAECPWATYAILEARDAIGGTWDLFRYPGVRSDSDMFTLGYPFRPWRSDRMIADGPSIRSYIRETAAEEGIDRHVRFGHQVVSAEWSSDAARWTVVARCAGSGTTAEMTCSFLFFCSGYYRYDHGYQPEFQGADRFGGAIVHPQHWPEELEMEGRRFVVIGSGATALTLVPSLAARGATVTMLQRSPTYVASVPARNPLVGALLRILPGSAAATGTRWAFALGTQAFYQFCQRHPEPVRRLLLWGVKRQLPPGYAVDPHFTPAYDPWDERMCAVPGGDLFRAIRSGRATIVTDRITTFTETGIDLESGRHLDADIIVAATGLELLFLGGTELRVDGEPVDLSMRLVYKGMMLQDVPNAAVAVGYTNASWTLRCDLTCRYVARVLRHMRSTGLRQCAPVNRDPSMTDAPLIDLQSGYVRRAVDRMPRQGSKRPWRVYQSYAQDYRATRWARVDDGVMSFTNPARRSVPAVS